MTNFEHYQDDIKKYQTLFTIDKNGKSTTCDECGCENCFFYNEEQGCLESFIIPWLCEEYTEPKIDWSIVEKDTKIIINSSYGPINRYFAKYEDGKVYYYSQGATSWSFANSFTSLGCASENKVRLAEE